MSLFSVIVFIVAAFSVGGFLGYHLGFNQAFNEKMAKLVTGDPKA